MRDNNYWNCSASVMEGDKFYIEGLNIWDHKWKDASERFAIKDPRRGEYYNVHIYEIEKDGKRVSFGAVEVSNMVFLIYTNYYQSVGR